MVLFLETRVTKKNSPRRPRNIFFYDFWISEGGEKLIKKEHECVSCFISFAEKKLFMRFKNKNKKYFFKHKGKKIKKRKNLLTLQKFKNLLSSFIYLHVIILFYTKEVFN